MASTVEVQKSPFVVDCWEGSLKTLLDQDERQPRQAEAAGHRHEDSNDIVGYYRQTIEDYELWSPLGYMHFGLWRPWLNPLSRKSMLEAMNDLVFDRLRLDQETSMTIGDFGCGLGAVSRYGCRQFPQHRWRAVTICREQVEYARTKSSSEERERVEYFQHDYCDLPFDDESLDAVFFLESLCHAQRASDPLSEAWRVLKPGGRLVVVDGLMRHSSEQTPRYVRRLAKAVAENWAVGDFHSLEEFESAAIDAGFVIESQREFGWQIVPCVAHSPLLVAWHSACLILTGRWNAWKRKHMIACGLGVLLGAMRHQFGYYVHVLVKPKRD